MWAELNQQGNIETLVSHKWWLEHEARRNTTRVSVTFDKTKRHVTIVPHVYDRIPEKETEKLAVLNEDAVKRNITRLFKKYFVKRPNGNCQVLFALTELDTLVNDIYKEVSQQ